MKPAPLPTRVTTKPMPSGVPSAAGTAPPLTTERWPIVLLALDGAPPVAFDTNEAPQRRRSRVTHAVVAVLDGADDAAVDEALDSLLSPKAWADTIRGTP